MMADPLDNVLATHSRPTFDDAWKDEEARANYAASRPLPRERPDEAYRGMLLPFRETTSGAHEWALPRVIQGPIDAAMALAHGIYNAPASGPMVRPSSMQPEVFNQMVEHGLDVAGSAITGTAPVAAMTGLPRNQLNAFMTPEQMGRLQEAGRVAPGARGSREALAAAEAEWSKGNLDTWGSHGWAHKSAFGPEGDKPIAWHDTRDFQMKPAVREAFDRYYRPEAERVPTTKPGATLGAVFEGRGLDDILTAQPSLADVPIMVGYRPADAKGATLIPPDRDGYLRGTPTEIEAVGNAYGPTIETMVHELMGHAVPMSDGALKIGQFKAMGSPITGTPAEAALSTIVDDVRSKMIAARLTGDTERWQALRSAVSELDELAYTAPQLAGYFAAPHERMAREAMMRHLDPGLDRIPPGRVDVYDPRAWPGGDEGMMHARDLGIPLRDFAPANSPFAKKD